jgi:hypothetical protein
LYKKKHKKHKNSRLSHSRRGKAGVFHEWKTYLGKKLRRFFKMEDKGLRGKFPRKAVWEDNLPDYF